MPIHSDTIMSTFSTSSSIFSISLLIRVILSLMLFDLIRALDSSHIPLVIKKTMRFFIWFHESECCLPLHASTAKTCLAPACTQNIESIPVPEPTSNTI